MPQLHVYVPDSLADEARRQAAEKGLSVSKYLAELLAREIGPGWAEGYFESVSGSWSGEPLERPSQGELEERRALK